MRQTLRRRFVLFAMAAVTVLLTVLVGAMGALSWLVLDQQSSTILRALASAEDGSTLPEEIGDAPFAPPLDTDTLLSTRFFTVRLDEKGQVAAVDTSQIASVSEAEARAYATAVADSSGHIEGYKYEVHSADDGELIVFMDMTTQREMFVMVLKLVSLIAGLCWLATLVFVVALSGRVVQPILAAMEKQKQFITNAGHELKTPLAIIQSNNDAATLLYGETKYSRNIRLQAQRLNVLMTNLLTLAKLSEATSLPTETVYISAQIRAMLQTWQEAAAEKGIRCTSHIQSDIALQVHQETFMQMVSILLDNAMKYTPAGGSVHFTLTKEAGRVVITCENDCAPVAQPDPEQLFERFYRGDSARTQDGAASGFGIGLSAARASCEAFGGSLTATYLTPTRIRFTARF